MCRKRIRYTQEHLVMKTTQFVRILIRTQLTQHFKVFSKTSYRSFVSLTDKAKRAKGKF